MLILTSPSQALAFSSPSIALPFIDTHQAPEGHYLHIEIANERFPALCVGNHLPKTPVAAIALLDHFLTDRTDAIRRFASALHLQRRMPDLRVSPYRKSNLRQMLQVIDGRCSGATYQEIAEVVLNAERVSATTWKTMPERDTVMRRFRECRKIIEGGYRDLLFRHRPMS